MEPAVPEDKEAQLVTPAKAAIVQPSQSAEPYVSDYDQDSVSEPSMLSPGSPVATVDDKPAQQQNSAASSPLENGSKQGPDEQLKPSTSSPSSRGGSGREQEWPVVPKRGHRKPWRYPGLHTSSSYRQLTTVGCCHQYTISGYALARSLGPGTRMCSDLFEAGGQQFRLEVYPAGVSADAARHVSVFLTTQASVNPNHIIYEIAVLDQSGRNRHLVHASKPQQGPCMMPLSGVVAGYPCFVRHALLDKHARRYLLNDCLVVRATVEIVRSWSAGPQQLAVPGSMTVSTVPYSQPVQPDFSSIHQPGSSLPVQAVAMHTAALQTPAVAATVIPAAAVTPVVAAAAAAAGRSDVTVYCSCPSCQVSSCCSSIQGYSAPSAAVHGGLCTAATAQNAAATAQNAAANAAGRGTHFVTPPAAAAGGAEDGSSSARGAGAQATAAGTAAARQYQPSRAQTPVAKTNCSSCHWQDHSSSPAVQAAPEVPAADGAAAMEQPCSCIACLTAQLQQLQCALGLQPPGSPIRQTQFRHTDQFSSCSPPAAAARPSQPAQYCSPGRPGVPSQVVYVTTPQAAYSPAAPEVHALPISWPPQLQQQPQFVHPMAPPYGVYYSPGSPAAYVSSTSQHGLQVHSSPHHHGGSPVRYSSMASKPVLAGPALSGGVVDVQDLGTEAGLAVPVARHHPVRVAYF